MRKIENLRIVVVNANTPQEAIKTVTEGLNDNNEVVHLNFHISGILSSNGDYFREALFTTYFGFTDSFTELNEESKIKLYFQEISNHVNKMEEEVRLLLKKYIIENKLEKEEWIKIQVFAENKAEYNVSEPLDIWTDGIFEENYFEDGITNLCDNDDEPKFAVILEFVNY